METNERPLSAEIWDTLHPAAQAVIVALQAQVVTLEVRVRELEARLGQNSSNSSRPPSSDPPQTPVQRRLPPSGRQPGGQPGHEAHQRLLLAPEQVDRVVDHWPQQCSHCHELLAPDPGLAVGEAVRHQVTDLPPIRPQVTEHRLWRMRCPACGQQTRAGLPPEVPQGAFGPRMQAVVAILSGRYRLSRREVAAVCADVLCVDLAVGSVDGLCQDTAQALAQPMADLEAAVKARGPVHADETHWRQAGASRWLWVAAGVTATVFRIASSRGSAVIKGLLGEDFGGWLITDRWTAYTWIPPERRQVCWAHLKRDFQAVVDQGGPGQPVGEAALVLIHRLFTAWHLARDNPAQRPWLREQVDPIQAEFRTLLETGQESRDQKAAGLCWSLLRLWPALWTFVTVDGVEPTNNRAEQAIRPAVLWRKGSFGTQSDDGAHFVERMLSVTATCKQQQRSLLEYLTEVCSAAHGSHPIPSLLPAQSIAQSS